MLVPTMHVMPGRQTHNPCLPHMQLVDAQLYRMQATCRVLTGSHARVIMRGMFQPDMKHPHLAFVWVQSHSKLPILSLDCNCI